MHHFSIIEMGEGWSRCYIYFVQDSSFAIRSRKTPSQFMLEKPDMNTALMEN